MVFDVLFTRRAEDAEIYTTNKSLVTGEVWILIAPWCIYKVLQTEFYYLCLGKKINIDHYFKSTF